MTEQLVRDEYERFRRSPDWELANIRKALTLMPFINSARDDARLEAVKRIQAERKAKR